MKRIQINESKRFFYDPVAAERCIRFIEKFCRHYEGPLAGKPFKLHEEQKRIIRDIFGWKHRATKLRRFTDVYWESAVGSGKSPLLAAIGLYLLIADGEVGAQVYSLANNYGQARVVFDCAKAFIKANRELSRRLTVVQYEIRHKASGSFWRIVSGKGPGAGCRPTAILGDELHQWKNAGGYHDLRDRMGKRRQPLCFTATNSGESRASFCWQLRVKAMKALDGEGDEGLYPIIWAADEDAKSDDPEAWKAANPLIGTTIKLPAIAKICAEAMADADPAAMPKFRRLYLSIWPRSGGGRWLNLTDWDRCENNFNASELIGKPLYIGLDLSMGDDLCAAAFVWPGPDVFKLGAHFWMPKATARKYEEKDGIPYADWAKGGHVTLLDSPTIGPMTRRQIAQHIIDLSKRHTIKAVCYDRYKADEVIAILEAAGITCVNIAQGYSVSPGCFELERRTKEASIQIAANPLLRWNAENVTVKGDDRGNIWPIKPNAAEKYAGRRELKIDGISAAVTALTEARKHTFPLVANVWKGEACLLKPSRPGSAQSASATSAALTASPLRRR